MGLIPEVTALDDLDCQAAGGAVVRQPDHELGYTAMLHAVSGASTVTACQAQQI